MLKINKLLIKNFRSIETANIDCNNITVFVGQNDAGKSNILRALNLFFNGQTDHALAFDFNRDYNIFSPPKANKAKEIIVELTVELPDTYIKPTLPKEIVWRKVWRATGLHSDEFRYINKQEFPARSRIPLLLNRVVFNYIPAIKDKSFFADLQGQVYDVLQTVAESNLRQSASSFEGEIQGHLKDLLTSVTDVFHSASDMRLPENLRQIFENLEFNSNGIPLSRRGDGIKIRHIPMILRFIAEKRNSIHKQGNCYHIWGFEEPENNVEMAACFELATQFVEASEEDFQIFITTHSPVFYGLVESQQDSVKAFNVIKTNNFSIASELNKDLADHEMGLMQIVSPFVNKERESWVSKRDELEEEIHRLNKEKADDKLLPHIFVEGNTDVKVITKAIDVFFPNLAKKVKIIAGGMDAYGSSQATASRAIAWQLIQQHNHNAVKGWLILDDDSSGQVAKKRFEDNVKEKSKHIKSSYWRVSNKPFGVDAGFKLPIDLEYLYSNEVWEIAENSNWLEKLSNVHSRLSASKEKKIFELATNGEQIDLFGGIDLSTQRRVKYQFTDEGKVKAADWIKKSETTLAKQYLVDFEENLKVIFEYFDLE